MKINELRIGNLCYYGNNIIKITASDFAIFELYESKGKEVPYKPIPLSEDCLLKSGYKSIGLGGFTFEHRNLIGGENRFVIESDGILFYPQINFDLCCWGEFKYIHHLQNLYFTLAGKEHKIKL